MEQYLRLLRMDGELHHQAVFSCVLLDASSRCVEAFDSVLVVFPSVRDVHYGTANS
jgi:hypothetical protein